MSSTSGSWWSLALPQCAHCGRVGARHRVLAAGVAVPDRDAVAPPQLAADAPVADVLHPVQVDADPALRDTGAGGRCAPRRWPARPAAACARTTAPTGTARSPCCSARSGGSARGTARSSPAGRAPRGRRRSLARLEAIEAGVARRRSSLMRPSVAMMTSGGRLWRWPISKSLASCAGVTFTAPVPNAGSTSASATTGIGRSISGRITRLPMQVACSARRRDSPRRRCRRASSPDASWRPPRPSPPSSAG